MVRVPQSSTKPYPMKKILFLYLFLSQCPIVFGQLNWEIQNIAIINSDTITCTLQTVLPANTFLVNTDSQNLNSFISPPLFILLVKHDSTTNTSIDISNNPNQFSRMNYETYGSGLVQFEAYLTQSNIRDQKNIMGKMTYSIITPSNKLKNYLFKFRLHNKGVQLKTIHIGYEGFQCFEFNPTSP